MALAVGHVKKILHAFLIERIEDEQVAGRVEKNGRAITSPAAPLPEARFKIVEQAKINQLQRLAKERGDSHLILGILYAHNGLLDEAEGELQIAIHQNQEADTAKKLLQSVKALRP
jgi:hypothetical protein